MESIYATGVTAAPEAELDFEGYIDKVLDLLSRSRTPWSGGVGDPEVRKHLDRISAAVRDASRLEEKGAFEQGGGDRLRALLSIEPDSLRDLDAVLEVNERWDQLLIEVGDEDYIFPLLESEHARRDTGTPVVTWRTLYGAGQPKSLASYLKGEDVTEQDLAAARNRLAALYRTRLSWYLLYRARARMKGRILLWLAVALGILVGLFALTIAIAESGSTWSDLLLAGVAGAVGATMSGTFKLRDQVAGLNALREFKAIAVVQPLLGAASALFLLLVLESGLVQIGEGDLTWAKIGAVGFVAGFSEPFFLGVVGRVAGIEEDEKKPCESE
jgi:hypothetical protein